MNANPFAGNEAFARELRPRGPGGELLYFAGHSLGLMPASARDEVARELDHWASLAVEAHFEAADPWYTYADGLRAPMAELVGAQPAEIALMNGLTVNLNLLLTSFYRPKTVRHKILVENHSFPSDLCPRVACPLPWLRSVRGDHRASAAVRRGDTARRGRGDRHRALWSLMGGVNYLTGQAFDLERITAAARRQNCTVGFDLAHSVGNLPHRLHDWGVDFAVWCTYKYLNGGPGAVAGCFVHERHARQTDLPRLTGWWGIDPATRFRSAALGSFQPQPGAGGWQISNPPILALAPLKASRAIFREAGIDALRDKSVRLTGYLESLLDRLPDDQLQILTPRSPAERGCALSFRVHRAAGRILEALREAGVVIDLRAPDVLRVAPVPLYNGYHEVWRFASLLAGALSAVGGGGRRISAQWSSSPARPRQPPG